MPVPAAKAYETAPSKPSTIIPIEEGKITLSGGFVFTTAVDPMMSKDGTLDPKFDNLDKVIYNVVKTPIEEDCFVKVGSSSLCYFRVLTPEKIESDQGTVSIEKKKLGDTEKFKSILVYRQVGTKKVLNVSEIT